MLGLKFLGTILTVAFCMVVVNLLLPSWATSTPGTYPICRSKPVSDEWRKCQAKAECISIQGDCRSVAVARKYLKEAKEYYAPCGDCDETDVVIKQVLCKNNLCELDRGEAQTSASCGAKPSSGPSSGSSNSSSSGSSITAELCTSTSK